MHKFKRLLNLNKTLKSRTAFLFGARGTGKTSLILESLPDVKIYDLLEEKTFLRLLQSSEILDQENSKPNSLIVIDEIQKLPKLLDEVQRLITKKNHRFLLTGSSARKLKRQHANLLGGRARELHLFPLTWKEMGPESFNLMRYLNYGGLPSVYLSDEPSEDLKSYISLYLREEIAAEALSRRLDSFARFLDTMALSNGEELHLENIASDCGVKSRTVANHIEILEDTLLGFRVIPYNKTKKRKAITRSKFYFFDLGVTAVLAKRGIIQQGSEIFGKAFEHWIALEIRAALDYLRVDIPIQYWRTKTGFEVDFILGTQVAIEVKSSQQVTEKHLKGLKALSEEAQGIRCIVISQDPYERLLAGVRILPWQIALEELWSGTWFT